MTFSDPVADFHPTHVVPQEGLLAWEAPDVSRPTAPLDPFLPVQLLSRRGEWGEVLCANGWSAWVDERLLVAVPQRPPTGGKPLARSEDPRPLLGRSAEAVEHYRRAADELASGRVDSEAFRSGTRGLRAGIVVDGESVWLYDEATGRWMYGDGNRLATYAVAGGPGGPEPPAEDAGPGTGADVRAHAPGPAETVGRAEHADGEDRHEPTRIATPTENGER